METNSGEKLRWFTQCKNPSGQKAKSRIREFLVDNFCRADKREVGALAFVFARLVEFSHAPLSEIYIYRESVRVRVYICMYVYVFAGADESKGQIVLFHEPPGHWDLAVRARRLRSSVGNDVCRCPIQPLRVEVPAPVQQHRGERGGNCGEPILPVQQLLVHHWDSHATGKRS